jgi:hypothetical protein
MRDRSRLVPFSTPKRKPVLEQRQLDSCRRRNIVSPNAATLSVAF